MLTQTTHHHRMRTPSSGPQIPPGEPLHRASPISPATFPVGLPALGSADSEERLKEGEEVTAMPVWLQTPKVAAAVVAAVVSQAAGAVVAAGAPLLLLLLLQNTYPMAARR